MSEVEPETIDEVIKECRSCNDSVLTAYLEDGLCHQCRK
jgi:hypothetical protein